MVIVFHLVKQSTKPLGFLYLFSTTFILGGGQLHNVFFLDGLLKQA